MRKYFIFLISIICAAALNGSPLHTDGKHNLIIETACSGAELRAISILINHPLITVEAIIIADKEMKNVLDVRNLEKILEIFKADSIKILHADKQEDFKEFLSILNKTDEKEKLKILSLCQSTLTGELNKIQGFEEKIEDVILFENSAGNLTEAKLAGLEYLPKAGIHLDIIANLYNDDILIDKSITGLYKSNSSNISSAFKLGGQVKSSGGEKKHAPEIVAVYLTNPELFKMSARPNMSKLNQNAEYNLQSVREVISDMITGEYKSGQFVALYGFPLDRKLYTYDIRQIMDSAILRYGTDEWKACVMTDEFHGHLGIYSIVGAKMGILARDVFGIGPDLMSVESFAGSIPPFSCMNDGIQASVGATLGQGTIKLSEDKEFKPQMIFTYNDKSIIIRLKPEYHQNINSIIADGVKTYGLADEGYWTLIRQACIKLWLEWDRKVIFEVEEL